jgi:MFS-type transporter involved in bile tolerance (Atg22 family)
MSIVAISAGATYTFYYLITIRGMSQATASLITLGAGGIGIWGTFLGVFISNRYGRVVSLMLTTVAWTLFMIWFYLINGEGTPYVIAVFLAVLAMTITLQAREVAFRTLITELYPTRLRSTFSGVLAFVLAIAVTISHFLATLLIEVTGRMDLSVIMLVALIIPATAVYLFVPDTKGIELDNQSLYDRGTKPIDTILLRLKVRQTMPSE